MFFKNGNCLNTKHRYEEKFLNYAYVSGKKIKNNEDPQKKIKKKNFEKKNRNLILIKTKNGDHW